VRSKTQTPASAGETERGRILSHSLGRLHSPKQHNFPDRLVPGLRHTDVDCHSEWHRLSRTVVDLRSQQIRGFWHQGLQSMGRRLHFAGQKDVAACLMMVLRTVFQARVPDEATTRVVGRYLK